MSCVIFLHWFWYYLYIFYKKKLIEEWSLASLPQNLVPGEYPTVKNGPKEEGNFRPMLNCPEIFPLIDFQMLVDVAMEMVCFCCSEISLYAFSPPENVRPCFRCCFPRSHLYIVILPSIGFWCSCPVFFKFPISPVSCLVRLPEVADSWSPCLGRKGKDGMEVVFLNEAVSLLPGFFPKSAFVSFPDFPETVLPYQILIFSSQVPYCRTFGLCRASQFVFNFPCLIIFSFPKFLP